MDCPECGQPAGWYSVAEGPGSGTYHPQLTFANAAPGDVEAHVFEEFSRGNIPVPTNLLYPTIDLVRRSIGAGRDELHGELASTPITLPYGEQTLTGFCGPAAVSVRLTSRSPKNPFAKSEPRAASVTLRLMKSGHFSTLSVTLKAPCGRPADRTARSA